MQLPFLIPFIFPCFAAALFLNSSLPIIDLGYVRQQATEYNTSSDLYIYKNIRYARPPLGDLRFRKPELPLQEPAGSISDGSQYPTTICSQVMPAPGSPATTTPSTNGSSEDCLFLDVYVPSGAKPGDNIPVLVWIYGSGYLMGSKDDIYINPTGLFRATGKPMIFVTLNYRLGAFGWAAPPSEESVIPNIGLYDTRAALKWIQQYISKFGGNASDVTAFGISSGGAVIMHAITSYGGEKDPPLFQKAILQSPFLSPTRGNLLGRDELFNTFMTQANCSDLACLRSAPTDVLIAANNLVNQNAFLNGVGFSPVVDGDYVPDLPGKLLSDGRYHKTLASVITANTEYEGRAFLSSLDNVTIDQFNSFLIGLVPNMTNSSQDAARALYLNDTSQESIGDRTASLISDVLFTCNAQIVASSYAAHDPKTAFRYIFAVPPALHGYDLPFTFYSYGSSVEDPKVTNTTIASTIQQIITSLSTAGAPEIAPYTPLAAYGEEGNILVLNVTGVDQHTGDPWQSERCAFWQKADYVQG